MNAFSILTENFKKYNNQTIIKNGINVFEIINPFWEENICVVDEDNELTFYFSYQHVHFKYEEIEELIQYINEFLMSERAVIELFVGDEARSGGDIEINDFDVLPDGYVLQDFFGDDYKNYINANEDNCLKIRGWNNKYNKDINL